MIPKLCNACLTTDKIETSYSISLLSVSRSPTPRKREIYHWQIPYFSPCPGGTYYFITNSVTFSSTVLFEGRTIPSFRQSIGEEYKEWKTTVSILN
jgi:hypothetical protein